MSEIAQPSILVELKSIALSGGTQQGKGYCMATLKARYVQKARKRFTCDWCERGITGAYVYLYGNAESYEEPFVVRLHTYCVSPDTRDVKIKAALDMARSAWLDIQELNAGIIQ